MKRFGYVIAALGAIAIAAPSIASAETVVIKKHERHFGDHRFGPRAEFREHRFGPRAEFRVHRDRGWHEGWRHRHADKTVIIKKHRTVY
ncbi:MAG: hypothetical protein ACJ8EK_15730 [Bradyrhizobium sp.]|jgi:hypothetical protein